MIQFLLNWIAQKNEGKEVFFKKMKTECQIETNCNQRDDKRTVRAVMFILRPHGLIPDWQIQEGEPDSSQERDQQAIYEAFCKDFDQALYELAFVDPQKLKTPSAQYIGELSRWYLSQIAKRPEREFLREALRIEVSDEEGAELIAQAPFMNGMEYLDIDWLRKFGERISGVFAKEIQSYNGTVAEYLADRHATVQPAGRIYFHLVENKKSSLPFAFLATYAAGLDDNGKVNHLPLSNALKEYRSDRMKLLYLLSTVNRAAEQSPLIRELLDSGEIFQPIGLTADEAYTFLREIPLYESSGIICRMPDWWKKRSSSARVSVAIGNHHPSRLSLDALVDFHIEIAAGDLQLTKEEVRQLLSESEGLVLIKGRWIEVDHARLQSVLNVYEKAVKKAESQGLTLIDAMRLQLHMQSEQEQDEDEAIVEVSHGEWLQAFLKKAAAEGPADFSVGDHFLASLRPYQKKGLEWLFQMKALGLGACLADDMGLGKTVQVLALLNGVKTEKHEKNLLVVPASLIDNWRREMIRFTPALRFCILHPSEKIPDFSNPEDLLQQYDLLITTYGMLERYDWLFSIDWDNVIIDEAQAIKNPATRQSHAVKKLKATFRVALTGTPIENNLMDLWSLFDFLNQGLLGSARSFATFSKKLREGQKDYAPLKQVLSPFILRRLKTDKEIISDLPEKIEMKTYAGLSKKQFALYDEFVNELKGQLKMAKEGIERKGLVLTSLLKLKQICNHPDQYLGQQRFCEDESGKFIRLREICETIYDKRERVLVFTQFKEMTEPLRAFLEEIFDHEGLVLHGGTPVSKRKDIIAAFQGEAYVPFLVLSLKAGGVGLNLTAANHVIHFDRWWNPAVENQATDRAFRIGQKKNVVVHKFLTRGTVEEKIDQMIEDKIGLARSIIPEKQEMWITEMDNQQLIDLFSLSL